MIGNALIFVLTVFGFPTEKIFTNSHLPFSLRNFLIVLI